MSRSLGTKIFRFGVVGVANTLVDLATFTLLVWSGILPLLANVGAWVVAICFSYAANSRWSFVRGPDHREARSLLAFFTLGGIISLGVSSATLLVLQDAVGVFPAKIIGTAVAAMLNFLAAQWSIETLSSTRSAPRDSAGGEDNPTRADRPRPPEPEC